MAGGLVDIWTSISCNRVVGSPSLHNPPFPDAELGDAPSASASFRLRRTFGQHISEIYRPNVTNKAFFEAPM